MPELLERHDEIAALDAALAAAAEGRASVLLVEGPAGIGKTALLDHARERADAAGFALLDCRCTPMTPSVPRVVVRDWFGLRARRAGAGTAPFDGPGAVLAGAEAAVGDLAFGARWVVEDDARRQPQLLVVDDVHWADDASLVFLDQLTAGLGDLRCVVLLGLRSGEPVAVPEALTRLRERTRMLTPAPLGVGSVRALVADPAQADEIARLSGGVPFYVRALAAAPSGAGGTPRSVVESVTARLDRLGPEATAVARAAAVLEGEGGVEAVARLAGVAGVGPAEVGGHLRRLAESDLLEDAGTRPVHPLVGEALRAAMGSAERFAAHGEAAGLLTRLGGSPDAIAEHLARTVPGDDPAVRAELHRAGERALGQGAPATAARFLARAVEEGVLTSEDTELLALTGRATAAAGDLDGAVSRWQHAAHLAGDGESAARFLAEAGDAMQFAGRHADAYAAYASLLAPLPEGSRARKLLTARMVMVGLMTDDEVGDLQRMVGAVLARPPQEDRHEDRLVLAAAAAATTFAGADAEGVRALAFRSDGDGRLLAEETARGAALYLVTGALIWAEGTAEALVILDGAVAEARAGRWSDALGTASYCRGYAHLRRGDPARALEDFETTQALRALGWNAYVPNLLLGMVEAHLLRGELPQAEALAPELVEATLGPVPMLAAFAHYGLGELAQVRGRHREAAEQFRTTGSLLAGITDNPGILPWRGRTAVSLAHLGGLDEAAELAELDLGLSRRWGAPRVVTEALLRRAALRPPREREGILREALAVAHRGSSGREGHEAAVALAELLLARGRAGDVEEVARLAGEADRYAATRSMAPLGARAARVLGGLGLRAVSPARSHGIGLSAAERRVVDLAAAGLSNRQVAGYLFLTVKAVEWHLSACYRKLGISSRRQLAGALGLPPGGDARAREVVASLADVR